VPGFGGIAVNRDDSTSDRHDVPAIPAIIVLDADGRTWRRHDGDLPLDGTRRFLVGALSGPR
jgi:hypothetical protein